MEINVKIGFIGAGNMGSAIIKGIMAGYGDLAKIYAYDTDKSKLDELAKIGVTAVSSPKEICEICKFVYLAIKPQSFESVLDEIGASVTEDNVLVSIAAGITEEYIISKTREDAHVVIVMPNTPFLMGEGATALAKGKYTTDCEFEKVVIVFATGGIAEEVPMDKMKEIIAINGSSPAFIYLYAKGFIDYAKKVGIDEAVALNLFAKSLIGSAKMLTDSGMDVDELIKMVSSPGGTTLAGLSALYDGNLIDTINDCCERCTKRAYELGK